MPSTGSDSDPNPNSNPWRLLENLLEPPSEFRDTRTEWTATLRVKTTKLNILPFFTIVDFITTSSIASNLDSSPQREPFIPISAGKTGDREPTFFKIADLLLEKDDKIERLELALRQAEKRSTILKERIRMLRSHWNYLLAYIFSSMDQRGAGLIREGHVGRCDLHT